MHSTIPGNDNTTTTYSSHTVTTEKHVSSIPVGTTGYTTGLASGISTGTASLLDRDSKFPTVIFRPLEAKFLHDKDPIGKMDPYCKFKIGWHSGKSSVAKSQGTHPMWIGETIVLKRKHNEEFARIKLKDRDRVTLNDRLGEVKIRLDDIAAKGKVVQWFTLEKFGKVTGEILLDIEYRGGVPRPIGTGIHSTHVPLTTTSVLTTGPTHTTHPIGHTATTLRGRYPSFTFRPLEAKFLHDKDLIGKMDPYCKVKIGWHSGKSSVAKSQGTHPMWVGESIVVKRKHNEEFARIKLKDRDRVTLNDRLGEVKIRLDEIAAKGRVTQWFTLQKLGKVTGEILLDIEYHPSPVY
jgi:hypothetical protein